MTCALSFTVRIRCVRPCLHSGKMNFIFIITAVISEAAAEALVETWKDSRLQALEIPLTALPHLLGVVRCDALRTEKQSLTQAMA